MGSDAPKEQEGLGCGCALILMCLAYAGAILGALYLLVRFVKWAWSG